MEIHNVVRKLIGPVDPVGESHTDWGRFENLKEMTEVADCLLHDIVQVALQARRHEASVSKAGKFAEKYLQNLPESIEI